MNAIMDSEAVGAHEEEFKRILENSREIPRRVQALNEEKKVLSD